ncbi:hypothetical protein AVEN_231835-1 [Araneus ventricosus]|uniref:Translocon-associated protein subunit delta n=1 Tax=Araneus ventricosus TaxID=182803 RepID=A0A4Y2N0H8_ARAVE|nr:hypothetical protein AVEN_231835-1 [Araneus ventricosus]
MLYYSVAIFVISLVFPALGEVCKNPKVDTTSYTTVDGMVISDVAFVTEFSVSCDSGKKDYILFADKKGRQIPALRSADNTKYQISWTESADSLFSGEHGVNVYDEEGYAAVKKVRRFDMRRGPSDNAIKALFEKFERIGNVIDDSIGNVGWPRSAVTESNADAVQQVTLQ